MLKEINLFNESQIGLKLSNHFIPSYSKLIGTKHNKLYIESLCRKKNRNMLKCICQCGNILYLYRWQLKYTTACPICQSKIKNNNLSVSLFNKIKEQALKNHLKFEIDYDYANSVFKNQNKRCTFCKKPFNNSNDMFLNLIQPSKGYVKGNVEWINKDIAKMKHNLSNHDFLKICKKIVKFYKPLRKNIQSNKIRKNLELL